MLIFLYILLSVFAGSALVFGCFVLCRKKRQLDKTVTAPHHVTRERKKRPGSRSRNSSGTRTPLNKNQALNTTASSSFRSHSPDGGKNPIISSIRLDVQRNGMRCSTPIGQANGQAKGQPIRDDNLHSTPQSVQANEPNGQPAMVMAESASRKEKNPPHPTSNDHREEEEIIAIEPDYSEPSTSFSNCSQWSKPKRKRSKSPIHRPTSLRKTVSDV